MLAAPSPALLLSCLLVHACARVSPASHLNVIVSPLTTIHCAAACICLAGIARSPYLPLNAPSLACVPSRGFPCQNYLRGFPRLLMSTPICAGPVAFPRNRWGPTARPPSCARAPSRFTALSLTHTLAYPRSPVLSHPIPYCSACLVLLAL